MDKALQLAYRFLKFRFRTVWEMKRYLQKKSAQYNFSAEDIENAITYLIEIKLLNDSQFVNEYVKSRNAVKPKSEFVLRLELRKLGVTDEILNAYFQIHEQNEEKLAQEALKHKIKMLQQISNPQKRFQKAIQFLQRRGFSFTVSKEAFRSLFQSTN